MSYIPKVTNLNAKTIDVLNTIRDNASYEYQSLVPEVKVAQDIPKVGDVLMGYPAMANQFINTLVNRIALVRVKNATFYNEYAELKKGYLENGETVEEVFVGICKAREFSSEKAEAREHKRTLPNVNTAFHTINWRVQYPVTIQNEDLRMAFTSLDGVTDLISRIVETVYTSAEYDEYLLFKYLMIKAIAHGKMKPVGFDGKDMKNSAIAFRGTSNQLTFMSNKYNEYGVHTTTRKIEQYIFMDSEYNAKFDVEVLASAFNMDKGDFVGRLKLIDDWTSFDNERFSEITANSTQIEEVTEDELALMKDVKAVLVDREWFQVYDNLNNFTEKYVASGLYWNYFYNVWKTVSHSPFSNAVVFVDTQTNQIPELPGTINLEVTDISQGENATVVSVVPTLDTPALTGTAYQFIQTEEMVRDGIAMHKYGAVMFPPTKTKAKLQMRINGVDYYAQTDLDIATVKVGATIETKTTQPVGAR